MNGNISCKNENNCFEIGKDSCNDNLMNDQGQPNRNFCYQKNGSYNCYWNQNNQVKSSCQYIHNRNFQNTPCREIETSAGNTFYVYTDGVVAGPLLGSNNENDGRSCTAENGDKYTFTAPLQQYNFQNASQRNIVNDCLTKCLDRGQECIGFSLAQPPTLNNDPENCFIESSVPKNEDTAKCALWTFDYFQEIGKMDSLKPEYPDKKYCGDAGLMLGIKKYQTKIQQPSFSTSGPMFLDSSIVGKYDNASGYVFNIFNQQNPSEKWSPENEKNAPVGTIWTCEGYLYPGFRPKDYDELTPLETPEVTNSLDDCWKSCMDNKDCSAIFFTSNDPNNPENKNFCTMYPYSSIKDDDGNEIKTFPFTRINEWNYRTDPYSYTLVKNDCDLSKCTGKTDTCVGGQCSCGSTGYGSGFACSGSDEECAMGHYHVCSEWEPHCNKGACQCYNDKECSDNLPKTSAGPWVCDKKQKQCINKQGGLTTGEMIGISVGSFFGIILLSYMVYLAFFI